MPLRDKDMDTFDLKLKDFPDYVGRHLKNAPETRDLEREGCHLWDCKYEALALREFIRNVCYWRGYIAIAGRITQGNPREHVIEQFRKSVAILSSRKPNVEDALEALVRIQDLGVAFASKHLRVLCPQLCPVLDSILEKETGYARNRRGYKRFLLR